MMLGGKNSVLRMILLFEEKRKEKPKPAGKYTRNSSSPRDQNWSRDNASWRKMSLFPRLILIVYIALIPKLPGIRKKQSLADLGIRPDMAQHLG